MKTAAEILRPFCAKCGNGKLVDEMSIVRSCLSMSYEFRVRCHGDEDTCIVGDEFFVAHRNVERGWAFGSKRIEEPVKRLES